MEKGSMIFVPPPPSVQTMHPYILCTVEAVGVNDLTLSTWGVSTPIDNSESLTLSRFTIDASETIFLSNTSNSSNSKSSHAPRDLIILTHLHEPSILSALETRFYSSQIYTNTGPILIAVNPFQKIPNLYTPKVMEQYSTRGRMNAFGADDNNLVPLDPHPYAVADGAFRQMVKGVQRKKGRASATTFANANQSILISGESGAGKTETTKN